jgi:glycosyltransferase involved in cell wall biosynthesis
MRIALVLTYPIYHTGISTEEWSAKPDRERAIAAFLARLGNDVELWVLGEKTEEIIFPVDDKTQLTAKIFMPDRFKTRSKHDFSSEMIDHAREFKADFHILKGVDGGAGIHLLKKYLIPERYDFVFIVGGECASRFFPRAKIIFYETEKQKQKIQASRAKLFRPEIKSEQLILLPKSVNTEIFSPESRSMKNWDIIIVGRLIKRYKNYDVLGPLSENFRVAVAGSGPDERRLWKKYGKVTWLGKISHGEIPRYLNQSRLFMYPSFRDYFPRVIPEAMACGIPCVAFSEAITPEVLPSQCGILVKRSDYILPIRKLLEDEARISSMGKEARAHAIKNMGMNSFADPVKEMLERVGMGRKFL